ILFIKISADTEILPAALEPEGSPVHCRIIPRKIQSVGVFSGRSAPLSLNTVQHTFHKSMGGGFSAFILSVKNIHPRRELHGFIPDLPEILYTDSFNDHIFYLSPISLIDYACLQKSLQSVVQCFFLHQGQISSAEMSDVVPDQRSSDPPFKFLQIIGGNRFVQHLQNI